MNVTQAAEIARTNPATILDALTWGLLAAWSPPRVEGQPREWWISVEALRQFANRYGHEFDETLARNLTGQGDPMSKKPVFDLKEVKIAPWPGPMSASQLVAELEALAERAKIDQTDPHLLMAIQSIYALTLALQSGQISAFNEATRQAVNTVIFPAMVGEPPLTK